MWVVIGVEDEEEADLKVIIRPYWQDFELVEVEIRNDSILQKIIGNLKNNPNSYMNYTLENEGLHYKGRMVLLATYKWFPKLIREFHIFYWRTFRSVSHLPKNCPIIILDGNEENDC